ncbi:MAG: tryptophan--tRNA ligase, partial [Acidobacteria bacterium]|nr:tryptophan--tRNA ligase [Acidobacteriota bacterium]
MRILSGIQPSGKLHLGNYLGAIKQHIELQDKGEAFYFIADYHALTSTRDKDALKQYTFDVALDYLSLGLDPNRATFYRQSDLPEVTELQWLLSTVTPMGLLERCHSYKDKISKGISPDHGL